MSGAERIIASTEKITQLALHRGRMEVSIRPGIGGSSYVSEVLPFFSTYTVQSSASKENCVCWGGFSEPSWGRLNLHLNGYNQMTSHLSPFRCQLSWLVCLQICCAW